MTLMGPSTSTTAPSETETTPSIASISNLNLSFEIIHPSLTPCTVPDEFCPRNPSNELVRIPGLRYYRNFLSQEEQDALLHVIDDHPWQKILARRQQFYGEVYYHTSYESPRLQPVSSTADDTNASAPTTLESTVEKKQMMTMMLNTALSQETIETQQIHESEDNRGDKGKVPFPLDMKALLSLLAPKCSHLFGNEGFPSQILVNEYLNNLGIASHFEDYHAFGPIILTLSLVSPVYMTLKKPKFRTNSCHDYWHVEKLLLDPGSLLVMEDEARWDYRHGISKYKWVHVPGREPICRNDDYRRVSITLRHLLPTRRIVEDKDSNAVGWRYRGCGNGNKKKKKKNYFCYSESSL